MPSEALKQIFFITQLLVLVFLILWVVRAGFSRSNSGFRVRESDRERKKKQLQSDTPLLDHLNHDMADDVLKIKKPLLLGGIRLDVPAHELLGLNAKASKNEIEEAFKKLMKQYHPDKVARPGSPQWQDAQQIAQALIAARDKLLSKR